jgi:hypothetical protein
VRSGSAVLARSLLFLALWQRVPDSHRILCLMNTKNTAHRQWQVSLQAISLLIGKTHEMGRGPQWVAHDMTWSWVFIHLPECCSVSMLIRCAENSVRIGCAYDVPIDCAL